MGLVERDPKGVRQYAQSDEVLLKIGDTYGECPRTGVESGEALLQFSSTTCKPDDLRI